MFWITDGSGEVPKRTSGGNKQHPEWSNSHSIRNPSRDSVTQSAWMDITAVLGTQKKYSWACVLVRTGGTYSHKIMQPTDSQTFSLPSPVLHGSLLTVLWFLITHLRVKPCGISVAESLLIPTKKHGQPEIKASLCSGPDGPHLWKPSTSETAHWSVEG